MHVACGARKAEEERLAREAEEAAQKADQEERLARKAAEAARKAEEECLARAGGSFTALARGLRWKHHVRMRWRGFEKTKASVAGIWPVSPKGT